MPGSETARARPKSPSLARPSGSTKMLCGLTSRCTIPRSAAACSAAAVSRRTRSPCWAGSGPSATRSDSACPGDVLHDQVCLPWTDDQVVDPDHRRAVERGEKPRLAAEPGDALGVGSATAWIRLTATSRPRARCRRGPPRRSLPEPRTRTNSYPWPVRRRRPWWRCVGACRPAGPDRALGRRVPRTRHKATAGRAAWTTTYGESTCRSARAGLWRGAGMSENYGPYEVLARVAEGSTSTVYRARHVELDRPTAIKELHRDLLAIAGMRDRLRAEAEILSSLSDANVVQVYDYVDEVRPGLARRGVGRRRFAGRHPLGARHPDARAGGGRRARCGARAGARPRRGGPAPGRVDRRTSSPTSRARRGWSTSALPSPVGTAGCRGRRRT